MRLRSGVLVSIVAVTLLHCRHSSRIADPNFLEVDESGCSRPRVGLLSTAHEVDLAVGGIGPLTTGRVNVKSNPELLKLMSDAAQDELVVQYLLCKAQQNGEIDFTNSNQVDYLRQFFAFMVSRPTADQVLRWQAAHPFPRPAGRLSIAAESEIVSGVRVIRFASSKEIAKKIALTNLGDAPLRWWCDGFIPSWVFATTANSPLAVNVMRTLNPGQSQTIEIVRTAETAGDAFDFTIVSDRGDNIPFRIRVTDREHYSVSQALDAQLMQALRQADAARTDTAQLIATAQAALANLNGISALARSVLAAQVLAELHHDAAAYELYRRALVDKPELNNDRSFLEHYARVSLAAGQLETGVAELRRLVDQLKQLPPATAPTNQDTDVKATEQRIATLLERIAQQQATLNAVESANTELRKTTELQSAALSRLGEVDTELREHLQKQLASREVLVSTLRSSLRITVSGKVLFGSGDARLDSQGAAVLDSIADSIKAIPLAERYIVVRGHADDRPVRRRYRNNDDLAFARADTVAKRLMTRGVEPTRILRESFGDQQPLGSNQTSEGRALNRRVEILIYPDINAMLSDVTAENPTK